MRLPYIVFTLILLAGCSREPLEIGFEATWGGEAIGCEAGAPALTDLRFYVSEIELLAADGRIHALDQVALIDLENGNGACQNGTEAIYASVRGEVPAADYRGLRFTVGVPFELNHADPLMASPPLDDAAMHWHWRSGYKFLRAGVRTADDSFWIHVGSAGCEGTVGNITGCRFPNRVTVELPQFDAKEEIVAIDLEALLQGTSLVDGEAGNCSSGPPEETCVAPFRALGIDFPTGTVIGPQTVFSATR